MIDDEARIAIEKESLLPEANINDIAKKLGM
jgi:hypothetical protein